MRILRFPTIPTEMEQIRENATKALAKLEKIDLNRLVNSITGAGVSVKQLAADPELHQAIASINQIVSDPDLMASVHKLDETLGNVNQAVIAVKNTINQTDARIDPLIASFERSSNRSAGGACAGALHPGVGAASRQSGLSHDPQARL